MIRNRTLAGQRGQAMAEFVVVAVFVLSVLLLSIVTLAKFNDIRNKVLIGSRYAAWERTVWVDGNDGKPESGPVAWDMTPLDQGWYSAYGRSALDARKDDIEVKWEFVSRIAAQNGAQIRGTDRTAPFDLPPAMQAMWNDHGGKRLVSRYDDVSLVSDTREYGDPKLSEQTAKPFGSVADAKGGTVSAEMDLTTRNLQRAKLSLDVGARNPALTRLWPGLGTLTFTDATVLLSNTWMPEGAPSGQALFGKAVPASRAELVERAKYQKLSRYAPEIDQLELGKIVPDVVPKDRVSQ